MQLSNEHGRLLLEVAKKTIADFVCKEPVRKPEKYPSELNEKRGVFCTIKKNGELRGCIGMPYTVMPLIDALISSACSCCEDPRFPALEKNELNDIKIEISVLTEPKLLNGVPEERASQIKIGEDGLIIQYGPFSGLLLPQVAAEHSFSAEQFLACLCEKAGLAPDMWKEEKARIYEFHAQVFSE